jgi:cyclophilin family peptidyl-prolyl cis-trans isomerase
VSGGDITRLDGTGSATVYGEDKETIPSEKTKMKFCEPYLLAMSSNDKGHTGSQFFITLDKASCLDNTKHTIIGRLLKGKDVLDVCVGMNDFRRERPALEDKMRNMPGSMGFAMHDYNKEKKQ